MRRRLVRGIVLETDCDMRPEGASSDKNADIKKHPSGRGVHPFIGEEPGGRKPVEQRRTRRRRTYRPLGRPKSGSRQGSRGIRTSGVRAEGGTVSGPPRTRTDASEGAGSLRRCRPSSRWGLTQDRPGLTRRLIPAHKYKGVGLSYLYQTTGCQTDPV